MSSRRALASLTVALLLLACSAPPTAVDVEVEIAECFQPATREPLPEALLKFLPTIDKPNFLENADRLLADGTISLARRPPFELPENPTWREDPYGDPTWVYEYQSLHYVLELLLAYEETGASRYLDAVELYAGRWIDAHLGPGFEGHWGDHVMADRTRILLLAWERLRTRSERAEIVGDVCRGLQLHAAHLINPEEYTDHNNHGHFQGEALLTLAYAFGDHPEQPEWLELARTRLGQQITDSVTTEGVHKEHSPSYHAGMQNRYIKLATLLDALELSLPIDLDGVITSMFEYMAYGTLPNGDGPLVGDSTRWFGSTNAPGITPEALYSFSQGRRGSRPAEIDRVFFDSGYAFFRDAWHPPETFTDTIYVGFFAGVFSRVHKHSDDMAVFVYGYGHEWLTDIGFWSYDVDDPYTHLARASAGHNVVTIDSRDYFDQYPAQRGDPAPKLLTDFELTPEAARVTGEHQFHLGVRYRRELTYERPARVHVADTLTAIDGQEHRYFLSWHLAPDKQVTETGPGQFFVETAEPNGPSMTIAVTGSRPPSCELIFGADDPYQGWYVPRFLQYEPAPVIACRIRGTRDAAFETQIELFEPGQ